MIFNKMFFELLQEQNILKTSKTQPLVDAIRQRHPITFYYTGPQKPEKERVLPGTRQSGEPVALGLSKKGNLIIRVFVPSPNVSKKGLDKTQWRTFMVSRMSNVKIDDEVSFDEKRPQYKEGDDDSMSVTYVTSDWTHTPEPQAEPTPEVEPQRQPEPQAEPTPQVEPQPEVQPQDEPTPQTQPTPEPQTEPTPTELPQPKPEVKPSKEPVQTGIVTPQNTDQEYQNKLKQQYDTLNRSWVEKQKAIGGNIKAGEGTRARFKKEAEKMLNNPQPNENPEEPNKLQESINRIKTLMFS
jgi:hypothetical protein